MGEQPPGFGRVTLKLAKELGPDPVRVAQCGQPFALNVIKEKDRRPDVQMRQKRVGMPRLAHAEVHLDPRKRTVAFDGFCDAHDRRAPFGVHVLDLSLDDHLRSVHDFLHAVELFDHGARPRRRRETDKPEDKHSEQCLAGKSTAEKLDVCAGRNHTCCSKPLRREKVTLFLADSTTWTPTVEPMVHDTRGCACSPKRCEASPMGVWGPPAPSGESEGWNPSASLSQDWDQSGCALPGAWR